ncbi:hypothetical protein C2G38_2230022 [Gigaspora rosea]|uniref:Uncharacterized protein n=1 Tax=Gigaspora rosea TaxID=44941 RepID=A0A397TV55_9GLOM|nr:hypothetical protein C2G38_2230022 [Gigaspora rosea]
MDCQDFTMATQIYKENNKVNASFVSDMSLDNADNNDDTCEIASVEKTKPRIFRFQAPSQKDINHMMDYSKVDPESNIFDKNRFSHLYTTIDKKIKSVQDMNPRQTSKSDSLTRDEIVQILNHVNLLENTPTAITYRVLQVIIPREKNHAGGLKNLNNSGRISKKAFGFIIPHSGAILMKE